MFGFFARFLGCVALAAGVAVATGDIARSLSADAVRISSLADVWTLVAAGNAESGGAVAPATLERLGTLGTLALSWPAAPALVVLAIVFFIVGRRPAPARLAR